MRQSEYSANVDMQLGAHAAQRTHRQVYMPERRVHWSWHALACLAFAAGFGVLLALTL